MDNTVWSTFGIVQSRIPAARDTLQFFLNNINSLPDDCPGKTDLKDQFTWAISTLDGAYSGLSNPSTTLYVGGVPPLSSGLSGVFFGWPPYVEIGRGAMSPYIGLDSGHRSDIHTVLHELSHMYGAGQESDGGSVSVLYATDTFANLITTPGDTIHLVVDKVWRDNEGPCCLKPILDLSSSMGH